MVRRADGFDIAPLRFLRVFHGQGVEHDVAALVRFRQGEDPRAVAYVNGETCARDLGVSLATWKRWLRKAVSQGLVASDRGGLRTTDEWWRLESLWGRDPTSAVPEHERGLFFVTVPAAVLADTGLTRAAKIVLAKAARLRKRGRKVCAAEIARDLGLTRNTVRAALAASEGNGSRAGRLRGLHRKSDKAHFRPSGEAHFRPGEAQFRPAPGSLPTIAEAHFRPTPSTVPPTSTTTTGNDTDDRGDPGPSTVTSGDPGPARQVVGLTQDHPLWRGATKIRQARLGVSASGTQATSAPGQADETAAPVSLPSPEIGGRGALKHEASERPVPSRAAPQPQEGATA